MFLKSASKTKRRPTKATSWWWNIFSTIKTSTKSGIWRGRWETGMSNCAPLDVFTNFRDLQNLFDLPEICFRLASTGKNTSDLVLLDENFVKDLWNQVRLKDKRSIVYWFFQAFVKFSSSMCTHTQKQLSIRRSVTTATFWALRLVGRFFVSS